MRAPCRIAPIERCVGSLGSLPLHFLDSEVVLPIVHVMHVEEEVRQLGTFSHNHWWDDTPLWSLGIMHFVSMLATINAFS